MTCHRLSCAIKGIPDCFGNFALHCAKLQMLPQKVAELRCELVHAAFVAIQGTVPCFAAHVAFYIQCHLPSMAKGLTVRNVYALRLDPESSEKCAHNSYPLNRGCGPAAKGWHAQHCDDATDALSKLVRKGGPAPTSVRYVGGLMKRCTAGNKSTQTIVRDMIASCMLGGYRHSTTTPTWERHKALLEQTTPEMVRHCLENKTNKQLHHMVAEYVSSNTLEHPALLWSVRKIAEAHASGVADGHLKIFGKHTANSLPTTYSIFVTMARALNVNGSVAPEPCEHSEVSGANKPRGLVAPTREQLTLVGATSAEMQAVRTCFSSDNSFSLKAMRMRLKKISPALRRFLREHVWVCMQSVRLQSVPFPRHVQQAQRDAAKITRASCSKYMQFCLSCHTPRSAVVGLKLNRSTAGTTVDLDTGTTICNKCKKASIVVIDMEGRLLTMLPQKYDKRETKSTSISICCSCSRQCVYKVPYGCFPMCEECLPRLTLAQFRRTHCLCGAAVSASAVWTTATSMGGSIECIPLCRAHAHLAPDHVVSVQSLTREITRACSTAFFSD